MRMKRRSSFIMQSLDFYYLEVGADFSGVAHLSSPLN